MLRALLLENPVLVKHIRARLRPQHLLPLVAMVTMVCGAIVWSGAVNVGVRDDSVTGMLVSLMVVQAAILLLVGTSRVAASVVEAMESGMLGFHRISPQRPVALTAGFLLGGPVREYVLFACTLPFSLFLALAAGIGPFRWLAVVLAILAAALLYHAIALVAALAVPGFRGAGMIVLLVLLHMAAGAASASGLPLDYLTIIPTTAAAINPTGAHESALVSFLGQPLSALLLSLLHQGPLLFFLLIAAQRKMRDELALPYAKAEAVLFHLAIALLMVMDVALAPPPSGYSEVGLGPVVAIYVVLGAGLALCLAVTPSRGQLAKGVRHARKLGLAGIRTWADQAANWAPLMVFGAIVLAVAPAASFVAQSYADTLTKGVVAAVVAALTLLCFGGVKQFLDLAYPRYSNSYFALVLFVLWGLPLLVGMLLAVSAAGGAAMELVLAISPLAGVHLAYAESYRAGFSLTSKIALAATLVPAIGVALLYPAGVRRATAAATHSP